MVVTMLPAGKHVRAVYETEVFGNAAASTLLIDCSTIDVTSAKAVGAAAAERGYEMVDAPVSGGVAAAAGGTLTRSEEHTSELQSLMRISYAVFCLKKNKTQQRASRTTRRQQEN